MADGQIADSQETPLDEDGVATSGDSKVGRLFRLAHPIGWVAAAFTVLAIIATIVGWDLLVARMPWWLWLTTIATIAISTSATALNAIRAAIERVSDVTRVAAMIFAVLIFFLQLFNVVTRYANNWFERDILFNQTFSLAWMSFGMLFLLGVNYGVRDGINPRIDFWWADWSARRKAWLDFVMHTFFFLPFLILGIRVLKPFAARSLGFNRFANDGAGSWPSGWRVWESWEVSGNAGELPVGPIQAFLFVGFMLWIAQVVAEMIKTGFVMAGRDDLGDVAEVDAPLRVE